MRRRWLHNEQWRAWVWLCACFSLLLPQTATAQSTKCASAAKPSPLSTAASYVIRLHRPEGDNSRQVVEVEGLSKRHLSTLAAVDWSRSDWNALLGVYVAARGGDAANRPPLLGTYAIDKKVIRFTPRFPLEAGLSYRAVFNPSRLPGEAGKDAGAPVVQEFGIPAAPAHAAAVVERVYPSTNRLPENQLKFYLHFSAPMSRGEAYRRIHLLDASGQEDKAAFLELGEELWDPAGKRFTLFIDPGRIKRGLKPREDLGPVLEQAGSYTLRIDRDWRDAEGKPLARLYEKKFEVGPPDEEPLDPTLWKIDPAPAGTRDPLTVTFPEPLDHAMLGHVLVVTDSAGDPISGTIKVESLETQWRFTPDAPWQAGGHRLVVDTALEDLAGNSIGRAFEVDVFRTVERQAVSVTVTIPFEVVATE